MSDLFGSSDEEDAGTSTPLDAPATNGLVHPTPESNGLNGHEENVSEEEEEEYTERGPRDDIRVSVLRFQKTADDFQFDIEVCAGVVQEISGWGLF